MELKKPAMAGTMESSDVTVSVFPATGCGIRIEIESPVRELFGDAIERTVRAALAELGVADAFVKVADRGALDCAIRARTLCALCRAAGRGYDWGKGDQLHAD